MSLSTLGRQLAAINNNANGGGRDVGATLPSSRRHEDAIGRGQHHSAHVGHRVAHHPTQSDRYRPSILYEDARKAADVPLATVRENCVASLRHLEVTVDPDFGPFVSALCKPGKGNTPGGGGGHADTAGERGLLTQSQNEKLDRKIEDLLYRLALHINDDSAQDNGNGIATVSSSCLHVVEFLLRRYDLHLRPITASATLLAFLPHHEEPFFLRLLQLIDLASLPEWAFLRPYAVPGARVGRSILALQTSKDTALVRSLAQLSQRNATLLVRMELKQRGLPVDSKAAGPSSVHSHHQQKQQQSLSFTAAVLVEALTLQTRRTGSMDEKTCQALLPFVVTACRNKPPKGSTNNDYIDSLVVNEVWQNWGHVMASTMVETTVCLAPEPRTLLVTSILQGIAQTRQQGRKDDTEDGGGVFWNGLIVALTILAQEPPSSGGNNNDDRNDDSRLPLLGGAAGFSSGPVRKYCGYVMDKEILTALVKLEGAGKNGSVTHRTNTSNTGVKSVLSPCFGHLYSKEGITDFHHWVASILVVGWKRLITTYSLMKQRNDDKNKNIRRSKNIFNLIRSLVEEPSLYTLWKEGNSEWVESYTAFVLVQTPRGELENEVGGADHVAPDDDDDHKGQETTNTLSPYRILEAYTKSVLKSLRGLDKAAYERGLTHALIQQGTKDRRMALAEWLGLAAMPKDGEDNGMEIDENPPPETLTLTLPPRVALEHADFQIRLGAIPTLVQEAKDEDQVDRMSVDRRDAGESILQALLRRFLHDDNVEVALLASKGLTDLMDCLRNVKFNIVELAEGMLEAISTWATRPGIENDIQAGLLCNAFRLASHAAARLRKSDSDGTLLVRLMEALGAFMCDTDERVSLDAAKALALVTKTKISGKASRIGKQAKLLLVSDENILNKYRRDLEKRSTSELFCRRRFFGVLVDAFVATLSSENNARRVPHILSEAIDYVIWAIDVFKDDLSDEEVKLMAKCLGLTAEFLAAEPGRIPSVFRDLASCNGNIFNSAIAPYVRTVCENVKDKMGTKVVPIAIVMEILISCSSTLQVGNLISLATDMAARDRNGNFYAVAPVMTLASRPDKECRALAICFLAFLQDNIQDGERESLFHFCQYFKDNSSKLLGGTSILSESFVSVLSTSEDCNSIKTNLMDAAACAAGACGTLESILPMKFPSHRWLDSCKVSGGYTTALTILEAAESAGESIFPLSQRWGLAGKTLLAAFLAHDFEPSECMSGTYRKLLFAIMRMLKGAKVVDPSLLRGSVSTTIISTGPVSRGGRARSYSFGRSEGVSYLNPYPKDMQDAIISVLKSTGKGSTKKFLLGSLFETILSSESWKREVFVFMDGSARRKIAYAVLLNAVESTVENADLIFLSLPLDSSDVANLLSMQGRSDSELSMLTYISDFVSSNATRLLSDAVGVDALFANIFKQVSSLSGENVDNESIVYARQALLVSLLELAKSLTVKDAEKLNLDTDRKFESWMILLIDILGRKDNVKSTALLSFQNKRTVFEIIAVFSRQFPKSVAPSIVPMITATMSNLTSPGESSSLTECLKLALPVYFDNLEVAGLSVPALFISFLRAVKKCESHSRYQLYEAFVDALGAIDSDRFMSNSPVGAFLAAMLAVEMNLATESSLLKPRMTELLEIVSRIWSEIPETAQIESLWTILSIAKDLLHEIIGEKSMNPVTSLFAASDLSLMLRDRSLLNSESSVQRKGHAKTDTFSSIQGIEKEICTLLMVVTCDVVTSHESRRILCHSKGSRQTLILRLWQDLLLLQSSCQSYLGGSQPSAMIAFVERIGEVTVQALDAIKNSLPSHMFLAFVSNLIKEGETEELRARAVQLIADRSASIQPVGVEANLFVDMIPALLALLEQNKTSRIRTDADKLLDQSVFAAVDSIGRNVLLSNDDDMGSTHHGIFSEVVAKATKAIEHENSSTNEEYRFFGVNAASRQLACTAAVCASTSVRVCGFRALPALPDLMKSLIGVLSDATNFLTRTERGDKVQMTELSHAKLMQLAILRSFVSILENLAKFLQPYIGNILRELSRIRGSLKDDSDNQTLSVRAELERVEALVTRSIPSRQLIPAAMKATNTITDSKSHLSILPVITDSVKHSTSAELKGQTKAVLKIAISIFEHAAHSEFQFDLIRSANELLLSLVLKLSEIQLRHLYSKMREWRGDSDSSDPELSALRRLAFWRLSSGLSEQLRSIFLPCLAMAFPDVINELVSIQTKISMPCLPQTRSTNVPFSRNNRMQLSPVCVRGIR
jgi:hypothetical protein